MTKYSIIGLMSGTSLDGLDIASCEFWQENNQWKFSIKASETVEYPISIVEKLQKALSLTQPQISELDTELGIFFGNSVAEFIIRHKVSPQYIASHGHTILHQPEKGITLQIGNGQIIKNITQLTVINNFRAKDVQLGGQGAPLVPIGDKLLFSEYDYCLNLGGIANISFDQNGKRIAYDICGCNLILNHLSQKLGHNFDKNGIFSKTGQLDNLLLEKLLKNPYLTKKEPKSLGKEHLWAYDLALLNESNLPIETQLRTYTEYIAICIGSAVKEGHLLITGGGAYNEFLIRRIKERVCVKTEITVPQKTILEFKEALIFAFLGVLRLRNETNVLKSVTGATTDSCSGDIYS